MSKYQNNNKQMHAQNQKTSKKNNKNYANFKQVYPLYAALCCGWVVMAGKGTDALVEAKEDLSQYKIEFR